MVLTIANYFRRFTGYQDTENKGILEADLTSSLIPSGLYIFVSLSEHTVSVTSNSTGEHIPDVCVAHLAGYLADSMYDRFNINPETGEPENRHWQEAMRLMEAIWGVRMANGDIVLPGMLEEGGACFYLARVDSQLRSADWKNPAVKTLAARDRFATLVTSSED